MTLTDDELKILSAWARKEWEPACCQLPSHRRQLPHGVVGAHLLVLIKACTEGEGEEEQDILGAAVNPRPCWPWSMTEDFDARLAEAGRWRWTGGGMRARGRSRGGKKARVQLVPR
jgi:hypothetical protein